MDKNKNVYTKLHLFFGLIDLCLILLVGTMPDKSILKSSDVNVRPDKLPRASNVHLVCLLETPARCANLLI